MNTTTLNIIRIALLLGVLAVGVVGYVVRSGHPMEPDPEGLRWYMQLFGIFLVSAAVGVFIVRKKRMAKASIVAAGQLNIVGWALGEAVALFGFIVYLITGAPALYLIGLLFFLVTFFAFPIPDDEAP